nr:nitroreductase [Alphaproteobacteria bacterium]
VAAHALGYGCFWRTGQPAYDTAVKDALGLAQTDHIVGFMYLGTPTEPAPDKGRRPEVKDFLESWPA